MESRSTATAAGASWIVAARTRQDVITGTPTTAVEREARPTDFVSCNALLARVERCRGDAIHGESQRASIVNDERTPRGRRFAAVEVEFRTARGGGRAYGRRVGEGLVQDGFKLIDNGLEFAA